MFYIILLSIVGSLRDREVACSASDRQGSNFESCVWRTVSSQSSHHPQEVLLAQFSLCVHKGGLKPDSFHFYIIIVVSCGYFQQKSCTLETLFWLLCLNKHDSHLQRQRVFPSTIRTTCSKSDGI